MARTCGTRSCYRAGCRCDACCAANSTRQRDTRAKVRASGFEGIQHGTEHAYNSGCRCGSCRTAMAGHRLRRRMEAAAEGFASYTHGVVQTYNKGCRCTGCVAARSKYMADWKRRSRDAAHPSRLA